MIVELIKISTPFYMPFSTRYKTVKGVAPQSLSQRQEDNNISLRIEISDQTRSISASARANTSASVSVSSSSRTDQTPAVPDFLLNSGVLRGDQVKMPLLKTSSFFQCTAINADMEHFALENCDRFAGMLLRVRRPEEGRV